MNQTARKWIEAGEILSDDPSAKVMCPVCGKEFLRIEDHRHEDEPELLDRYMICDACGAHQVLIRVPSSQ